jgi:hypothetical protein
VDQQNALDRLEALVNDADSLSAFAAGLRADLLAHGEEWQNPTLESFLDALTEVLENIEVRRESHGLPEDASPLALVAIGLHSAKYYE